MFRIPAILLVAAVLAIARAQQPSPDQPTAQPKCVIEGTATDALTSEPLRKVTVRLNPWTSSRLAYTSTTDLSGRFHFENVLAGDYTLEGERAGYLTAALGTSNGFGRRGTILHLQAGGK